MTTTNTHAPNTTPTEPVPATLRVVTHARWLADDLAAAAPPHVKVIHDFGLDLDPADAHLAAWWCPQKHAARLLNSGTGTLFTSPGPQFTERLPHGALGRTVIASHYNELWQHENVWAGRPVHAKLAEAKLNRLPAGVYPDLDAFRAAADAAGIPGSAWVQLSNPVEMVTEARCWILHREVVAASVYLHNGQTWDAFTSPLDTEWAAGWAAGVVKRIHRQPDTYTLDVARLADGSIVAVEANPAWASNPYHAQLGPVIDCILASQQADVPRSRQRNPVPWLWTPDPALPNNRQHTLPRRNSLCVPRQDGAGVSERA